MPNRRTGHVWAPGTGWVKKQETEALSYDNIGEGWALFVNAIRWYPDFLLDLLRSENADYELTWMQRMIMRSKARHQYNDITACRGATKTYCSDGEEWVEEIAWPGVVCTYFGPSLTQTAKIAGQTYHQLEKDYPALMKHFQIVSESKDRFEISTEKGSNFSIVGIRGNNVHRTLAEEFAQEGRGTGSDFDAEDFKRVVLPSVRLTYHVGGKTDPSYIPFKQHSITSAGRRQNHAYETRCRHLQMMARGESAFVCDIPYTVLLLNQMRPIEWAESLHGELTPDEWAREMESNYTGTDENPMVSDRVITEARQITMMEDHHCCKDRDCKLDPHEVFYIVGYDVSYADGPANAKCACVVIKCTKQSEYLKRDRYLKQIVWVDDWTPKPPMEQARQLKTVWNRYNFDTNYAYIAIDAWQYGSAVVQALFTDVGDGLPPLCSHDHELYHEYEQDGAVPILYPIKAGGVGATDSDADMVRYAQMQFEYRNVQMLTSNYGAGLEFYKKYHRIKDDRSDYIIYKPYKKTNELVGQIQNLKVQNGLEKRISTHIQRDSWSALKYALRVAQRLEREFLLRPKQTSDWDALLKKYKDAGKTRTAMRTASRVITTRQGGRLF